MIAQVSRSITQRLPLFVQRRGDISNPAFATNGYKPLSGLQRFISLRNQASHHRTARGKRHHFAGFYLVKIGGEMVSEFSDINVYHEVLQADVLHQLYASYVQLSILIYKTKWKC